MEDSIKKSCEFCFWVSSWGSSVVGEQAILKVMFYKNNNV